MSINRGSSKHIEVKIKSSYSEQRRHEDQVPGPHGQDRGRGGEPVDILGPRQEALHQGERQGHLTPPGGSTA